MKSFASISLVTVLSLVVGCKAALKGLYKPHDNRQPKIINGENMDIIQAPFMVALTYQGGFKCGGFLIDETHILTAYHCLHQIFNAVDVNNAMKYLTVTMIARNKRNPKRYTHKDLEAEQVIAHPNYNMNNHVNDIAIIKIKPEPDWKDWDVQYVKLPDQNDGRIEGREAVAYGWGYKRPMSSNCQSGIIEYSISSEYDVSYIDKVNLTVVDNASCMKSLKKQLPCASEITNTQMCAVGVNRKDTCKGDSGGCLTIKNDRNEPIAVGIVSYGYGCGNGLPGVYTKISKYTKWIRRNIQF